MAVTTRGRNIWLGVLGVGLALVALWGYGQMLQKNRVMQQAESSYQRAFHQVIDHTVNIESRLSKVLVSTNPKQQVTDLDNARQHATVAREEMGQLPLSTVQMGKTTAFFGSIVDTADALSLKLLDGGKLTPDDMKTLTDLHSAALYARDQLYQVSQVAYAGRMRWMDAEKLSATDYNGGVKNPLVENLLRFDGGLKVTAAPASVKPYRALTGADVSVQQATDVATRFLGDLVQPNTLRMVREVPGQIVLYMFDGTSRAGQHLAMEVTRKGGLPMWFLAQRVPKSHTLDKNAAIAKAQDFMQSRAAMLSGGSSLTFAATTYSESDNIALVALVPKQNDVLVYPDTVQVKVALDNGEIIGFNARDFLRNHADRGSLQATLTAQQAQAKVSPNLAVESTRLVLVQNERGQEVLAWEVRGTANNLPYQVFINAKDGTEESVQRADGKL